MRPAVAVVGMACRYPDARSPAELWENVLAQRRAFRRLPSERLRLADFPAAGPGAADGIQVSEAAVLSGWEFDRVRFRVVGTTYRSADPAHWLALDVAADALAAAGFPDGEGMPREATGVLVGNSLTGEFSRANLMRLRWPYVRRVLGSALGETEWNAGERAAFLDRLEESYKRPFPEMTEESLAGGLSNTIAGRLCNHFDLKGGGYTVDGACASSLLAVCQAASALAAGDLDVALAGGVDLSLDPFELVGFSRAGALAADEMRVFDRRSAGFLPGEGCGFVVLMRHDDAVAQGRRVHAVLRGWGISSDGHGGISRPEASGQLLALERAYRRAGFGIDTVAYFEGHGTGTAVGDATELRALGLALAGTAPGAAAPLPALGSVKANIGHTKAAAGVAGLLKAILAVESQVLPPNTGCDDPHPGLAAGRLRALARPEVWPTDRPLRAAVSAMGFGGINSHVVIEGAGERRRRGLGMAERRLAGSAQDAELLLLAAPDAGALRGAVERLRALAPRISRAELGDLAAALSRDLPRDLPRGSWRAAIVVEKPADLELRLAELAGWLDEGLDQGLDEGITARLDARLGLFLGSAGRAPRLGLLFPGQGSPAHLGGGAWRRRFEEIESLYERLGLPAADAGVDGVDTAVAQPAIITHSLAGLAALDLLGLTAVAAVGHSLGEVAALHWAGALGEPALLRIAAARGRAMADLGSPTGAMAAVAAAPAAVAELLAGFEGRIVVAGFNAPRSTVVSGEAAAVEALVARARGRGLSASRLRVSHAFHSPLVEAASGRLAAELAAESFSPPSRRIASTVTGGLLAPGADLPALLLSQVTSPVRFTDALAALAADVDLWIEVGPGRVLADLVAEFAAAPVVALDAGSPSLKGLLETAGAAYCLGAPLAHVALFAGRFVRPFDLDVRPGFLVNPCELAPQPEAGLAAPAVALAAAPDDAALRAAAGDAVHAAAAPDASPLEVVRRLVAARAELPAAAVREDSRLLSDLHLNSISVGQLVSEAARQLGLAAPASPSDYAQATIAEVARALAELAASGGGRGAEPPASPPGVDGWVRAFTIERVPRSLPLPPQRSAAAKPSAGAGSWQIFAPADHPLAGSLAGALEDMGGDGVAVCLPADLDASHVELLLAGAAAVLAHAAPTRFLVVQQDGGGGGFARTLHLELGTATRVVDLPLDHPRAAEWVAAEAAEMAGSSGFAEACYDADGMRRVPVLRPLGLPATPVEPTSGLPLGAADVLLVTGGGKGIAAESALALARATGARVALLGRSRPESDPELASNLERFRAAGVEHRYAPADVADGPALAAAVAELAAALGPITGVLHGAGINSPRLLGELEAAACARTLAPKLAGADNVLAAVDPDRLRLFVAFGSIIAETGMRGEADYALANEWLRRRTERLGRERPACRCLVLEWSVWGGVGMGERLGLLAALVQQGITPIPPDAGLAMLLTLLARPPAGASSVSGVSVVVTGRFGEPPTLEVERPELPLLRFLERPRVFYPGVELVVDTELSAGSDPYLEDHVFRGDRLLPAVMGLEAMAQAAMVLQGGPLELLSPPVFEHASFPHPVVVPERGSATIRVAALVREPGRIEVVLRTAATGFAVDHFRAICRFAVPAGLAGRPAAPWLVTTGGADGAPVSLRPEIDLYGGVLFHTGRFRRVRGYSRLSATECLAEISPDGSTTWFGGYLPADLVLGDPAVRDAAIHGIQACIPHATLLPIAVERIESARLGSAEPYRLAARERERHGDTFVYDLAVLDAEGRPRERWEGLTLRAVDRLPAPPEWSLGLLGPFLERRLQELIPQLAVRVAIERREGEPGRRGSEAVLADLVGPGRAIAHRPDGKPEAEGYQVSVSHAGDVVLAVAARGAVGCDLEPVAERTAAVWRDLLGGERYRLAELLASESGEAADTAATRVWAAAESLTKAGALHGAPLVLSSSSADGWQCLRSGDRMIGTLAAPVRELGGRVAIAILLGT